MGAGKPGLQRRRNDRRFPPLGVKAVPSYACATEKGGAPLVAHAIDHRNASLSEGGALAAVVGALPCLKSLIRSGLARIPRIGCDNRGGRRLACPRLARRTARDG